MAESLFDNRYRYDYIYPRGRSGETLRAVDTLAEDRRVVIKRPAPGDAPPIRAGQEVSILNEKKALRRLAGQPVLTELLGEGSFSVGGVVHQYIVMERAEGLIISDLVAELSAAGERIPELELLIIVDHALDLLRTAHAKDIVYNDVDARHLFWSRDTYKLKMIDWGNAVFLEGDTATPQGISRQTDVFQVGELLFFLLTGGRRAEIPREAPVDFAIDFGDDSRRVHSQLQQIVSKALHPNSRYRYQTIVELRNELSRYRNPLEQLRNSAVGMVLDKLRHGNLTKGELRELLITLEPALAKDPGYPPARAAYEDIQNRLRDLNVSADLDAVRIYISGANWSKAAELLRELQDKTGTQTRGLVGLLLDICALLADSPVQPIPETVMHAISMMFEGQTGEAATLLLSDAPADNSTRLIEWQIAERISSHIPEVLLLRPNLYRLQTALRQLAIEGFTLAEPRALLADVDKILDNLAQTSQLPLSQLRDFYRTVVERLNAASPLLHTFALQHQLSNQRLPLNALDRATNAAMALADNMHVIGKQASSVPQEALQALEISRTIDPANPLWDDLERLLDNLYDVLQVGHSYVPAADATDLTEWLRQIQRKLTPFTLRVADDSLTAMVREVEQTFNAWEAYRGAVLQGDKDTALESLQICVDHSARLSPTLTQWFSQLHTVIQGAQYIERHSVGGGVGRAIADGWQSFDRSRLSEAEHLGKQAYEGARSENERFAAARLLDLARLTNEWVERGGVSSAERTHAVLEAVNKLFTTDEKNTLDSFTTQMPSIETYLKAMGRGLVGLYARRSTAALHLLFVHYVMLSAQDANNGLLEDSKFWREAALKVVTEADQHVLVRTLDAFVARSYDLIAAQGIVVQINGRECIPNLGYLRRQLEENPQAKFLAPTAQGLREIEAALRDWTDGEFKQAGIKLENAVRGFAETETQTGLNLAVAKAWAMELMQAAAELHIHARDMRVKIEARPDQPDEFIAQVHQQQVEVTDELLGEQFSATLRQWRDTYAAFVNAYTADERRSRRLERLNELFRALFIDRHPAYPLYRHWYNVLESASEFAAPPSDDMVPRIETYVVEEDYQGERYRESGGFRVPRSVWLGGLGVLAALVIMVLLIGAFSNNNPEVNIALTITDTPGITPTTPAPTATMLPTTAVPTQKPTELPTDSAFVTQIPQGFATNTPVQAVVPPTFPPTLTTTPTATLTLTPTLTLTLTATLSPTPTDTPSPTWTPSVTPTFTATALPPQGVQGEQDVLALLNRTPNLSFNPELFAPNETGWRMGVGVATGGETLFIAPPLELLESAYGNNAVSRIRSVEADLTLTTFNPSVVNLEDIYFGVLLQSVEGGSNAGIRLQVTSPNVISLGRVINNEVTFFNQRSVNTIVARLRVDRDVNNGQIRLYFNDIPMGEAFDFLPFDAGVLPMLYVKEGGVILGVTGWRIELR